MQKRIATLLVLVVAVALAYLGMFTNHSYITTPSMYPTIPPGSMIFVSPATQYHVGEVIEFRANGIAWHAAEWRSHPPATSSPRATTP